MSTLFLFLFVTFMLVWGLGSGTDISVENLFFPAIFILAAYGISAYQLRVHEDVADMFVSGAAESRIRFAKKISAVSRPSPEDAEALVSSTLVDVNDAGKVTAGVLDAYGEKAPTTLAEREAKIAELTAQAVKAQRDYRAGYKKLQAQYQADVVDSLSTYLFVKVGVLPKAIADWPDDAPAPLAPGTTGP